jgi:uncharacterized membrane protein
MDKENVAHIEQFGPVQVLAVAFDDTSRMSGEVLAELKRLQEHDVVRLVDLLVVRRDDEGEIEVVQRSDLTPDEATAFGSVVGALLGVGASDDNDEITRASLAGAAELEDGHLFDTDDVWYLADSVPKGSAAAVALLEHRWAVPLRDKILAAGGRVVADEWLHPADLVAVGAAYAGSAAP